MARKPLAERTVAAQVLATGTGAINVGATRIAHASEADRAESEGKNQHTGYANPGSNRDSYSGQMPPRTDYNGGGGRWPSNVVLDERAAALIDEVVGERPGGGATTGTFASRSGFGGGMVSVDYGDTGGPSRFFYTAKASTAERDGSTHPTVKPRDLMRWLVRMVTPPGGGVVLDCFAGSGTTLLAARDEGFRAIGIERDADYCAQAAHRLRQLSLLGGAA